jgi:outer membrane protein OmpA-like peptidoglycan-associated protein
MIVNLKRLNFVDGEIGGYTDSTGSPAHNLGLSERRAQSVADYLTGHGISAGRTIAEWLCIAPTATSKRIANRRSWRS